MTFKLLSKAALALAAMGLCLSAASAAYKSEYKLSTRRLLRLGPNRNLLCRLRQTEIQRPNQHQTVFRCSADGRQANFRTFARSPRSN